MPPETHTPTPVFLSAFARFAPAAPLDPARQTARDTWSGLLQVAIIGCILFAFLGGKFSFTRFASETTVNQWFELRLWFTCTALAGIFVQRMAFAYRPPLVKNVQVAWIVSSVVLLHAFLLLHLAWRGNPARAASFATDFAYIVVHAVLFAYVVRTRRDILTLVYIVEAIGVILFALSLVGMGNRELYGHGWAPFGTPLTFYRVEYLVFCCAMLASLLDRDRWLLHIVIAGVGLFCTFASASKAAYVAAILVMAYSFVVLCTLGRWKLAVFTVAVQVTIVALFHIILGWFGTFYAERWTRATRGLETVEISKPAPKPSEAPATPSKSPAPTETPLPEHAGPQDPTVSPGPAATDTPPPSQSDPLAAPASKPTAPKQDKPPSREKASPQKTVPSEATAQPPTAASGDVVVIPDPTQRIRMSLHGINLFLANKTWGVGFGNYSLDLRYADSGRTDTYYYPHNIVVEILAATGVIGFAIFAIALIATTIILYRALGRDHSWTFLQANMMFIFLTALFAGDIYDFRGVWLTAILIANAEWQTR